ncbi:putative disease resistance protein, partial [Quercus suber]
MAVAMKIGVEEIFAEVTYQKKKIFAEVIAALHDTFKKGENKALLKCLGSRRRLYRLLRLVIDGIKRLNLPKKNTKSWIEDVKKGENLARKCSKSLRWICCLKVCCPTESDEDSARSCEDDTEANSTRNNGAEISLNLKITLEKEDSNLDKKRVFCGVRRPPDFTVGFDKPMMELKTLLLKEEFSVGMFANNILFVNISKTPNVKVIVQNLFSYKGYQPKYQIQSEVDAIRQLPQMLSHIGPNPILLILDDVWLGSESLFEKFKFNIPNYKILVTSRTAFPRFKYAYNLKQLNDVDAMTLFCHSAFLQDESSYIPEEDIKK